MSAIHRVLDVSIEEGVAVLQIDSPPVNTLRYTVRRALQDGLIDAVANPAVKAIVILCAGRTFFAGADITELDRPIEYPRLDHIFETIEHSSKPVIAAIHGTALGGGFELALACHYRVALPSAKVGLPEVLLGLIPGAGGTQRAPRLVGAAKALELLASGQPVAAPAALADGLLDALIDEAPLRAGAIAFAERLVREQAPLRRVRDMAADIDAAAFGPIAAAYRANNPGAFVGFKASALIVAAIEAAVSLDFEAGLARENALFEEARTSAESAAQRHIFFAERATSKIPGLAKDAVSAPIANVLVIGSGAAAAELVRIFSAAGLRSMLAAPGDASGGDVAAADLIVEAGDDVDWPAFDLAGELAAARPDALVALSSHLTELDRVAATTQRPDQIVGIKLCGPRLIEIARGTASSDAAVGSAMALGRTLGRVAVLTALPGDMITTRVMGACIAAAETLVRHGVALADLDRALRAYGLPAQLGALIGQATPATIADEELLERLLYPVVNETAKLLEQGVALRASDIDVALCNGCGWPAYKGGPMFWADLVGLPKVVAVLDATIGADAVSPLLRRLTEGGGALIA